MKAMMKKSVVFMLIVAMLAAMVLSGCKDDSGKSVTENVKEGTQDGNTVSDALKKMPTGTKIGMTVLTNDGLFAVMAGYVQVMADAMGFELLLDVGAFSPEEQIASVENLIAAGCQGVLFCNFSEAVLPKIAEVCEEAEVYWVQYSRDISDQEVIEAVDNSKYYVGRVYSNREIIGTRVADKFAELGCKTTAIIGPQTGDVVTDEISAAFIKKAEELGIEVYTEVRNADDAADNTAAVETIVANYPDVESLMILSGATGKLEGVFKGLENVNKLGIIKVGSLDTSQSMVEDFENGNMHIGHAAFYLDLGYSCAILMNAVLGTPLSDNTIEIVSEYLPLTNGEEAEYYLNNIENVADGVYGFTPEEIAEFIKYYNPDATVELIQNAATELSVEDVMERHGNNKE